MNEQKKDRLEIDLDEKISEGTFSNLVIITHSNAEFVLDFVRVMPGVQKAKVKSRIIITPQHAKRFLLALKDNITKYENTFGKITIEMDKEAIVPTQMFGPSGQA